MTFFKSAAIAAAFMLVASTSFAFDHIVDGYGHHLDEEIHHLQDEVHDHYPNSHLDTDVHEVHEALERFMVHVEQHHGGHAELYAELVKHGGLREKIRHLYHTANSAPYGHYDRVGGFFDSRLVWHSSLHPHVRTELNAAITSYNRIYNHLRPRFHHDYGGLHGEFQGGLHGGSIHH